MTMKSVRTIAEHENEFGDAWLKAAGDEYVAPADAADALEANGYVKFVQDDGRQGSGSSAETVLSTDGKGGRTKGAQKGS